VRSEQEQELDVLPLPRSDSTSSAGGERSPSIGRCPARSLSSSAAVDRQSSLLRLVTTRRAVHHQQLPNGNCASTSPVMVPAYGVETSDEEALRQVRDDKPRLVSLFSLICFSYSFRYEHCTTVVLSTKWT